MTKADRLSRILNIIVGVVILTVAVSALTVRNNQSTNSAKLNVVAAENFWGSLVKQVGGNKVNVFSVVSDPNADPHEYEVNSQDALKVAKANYVIINGVGYDSWANKLLSANPNSARKVLNVGQLLNKSAGDNPHIWYNPAYVNRTIKQMEEDLSRLDPQNKTYFEANYNNLTKQLATYQDRIKAIKRSYANVKVAATEDIFAYLAQAAGLDLVSPPAFTEAVAEGNDPPADSLVKFEQQLNSGEIRALVYNEQTVTPLTESIKSLAAQNDVPVVGVTETIQPPGLSFEAWMNSELINLQNALNAKALGS